jgi:LacI family transcriptional regulator
MSRAPRTNGTNDAVTLSDVARVAGVSLATASRALNGSANRKVRDDLVKRVQWAAEELNYSPNAHAQAMVRGHTNVVGLIVSDIADAYFSSMAAGVMRQAEQHGLLVTMAVTQRSTEREIEYVETLRRQRARALIIAGSRVDDRSALQRLGAELESFERNGGRVAMVSQRRLPVNTVLIENRAGARDLAEALHGRGYRRFAVLAGPRGLLTARDRLTGFREALGRLGCDAPRVVHGEFTRDGGYEAMAELIAGGPDTECVFAVNDVMAVGAMAALRERGVQPGRDIGVAGFDDIVSLRDITPGLTTVRVPLEDIGARAFELAVSAREEEPKTERVKGEIVLRESTPGP